MSEETWKPVPDAGLEAGVPERTLYRWIRQKRLATRQEGGITLVEVEALKTLAAQRDATKGPATAGSGAMNGSGSAGLRDPGEVAAEVFARFEDGTSPIDVVQEMTLPPERVAALHRSWLGLKDAQRTGPSTAERLAKVEEDLKALRDLIDVGTSHGFIASEVEGLQLQVAQIEQRLAALPVPSRDAFSCGYCGAKGWVAAHVRCTVCGSDSRIGFHPSQH
jgi:hypothetical protein